MPISTNLVLTTKNGNKTKTQNITYVNPNAADSDLSTFMASFCGLSKNEFVSLNRVDKHELTVQISKPSPELSLAPQTVSITMQYADSKNVTASRLGNGAITVSVPSEAANNITASVSGTTITISRADGASVANGTQYTLTVSVAETAEYAAESATITVTMTTQGAMPSPE